MAAHVASVEVDAPVEQVFALFSHFNDFPKFMSFVHEVTYVDTETSHWVVDMLGRHEWVAVNEGWETNRRIGWKSVDGLPNVGSVTFTMLGETRSHIEVSIDVAPPGGILGSAVETFGAGAEFERRLSVDLMHFAQMVHEAPAGALDPNSSSYLFHAQSSVAFGSSTQAQKETTGAPIDAGIVPVIPGTTTEQHPTQ